MRELPAAAPPVFCSRDGLKLNEGIFVAHGDGFDVITGQPVTLRTHEAKACPTHCHDEWRLYDEKWIKVR